MSKKKCPLWPPWWITQTSIFQLSVHAVGMYEIYRCYSKHIVESKTCPNSSSNDRSQIRGCNTWTPGPFHKITDVGSSLEGLVVIVWNCWTKRNRRWRQQETIPLRIIIACTFKDINTIFSSLTFKATHKHPVKALALINRMVGSLVIIDQAKEGT